jgi:hypothetical protein
LKIALAVVLLLVGIQYGLLPAFEWHGETTGRVVSLRSSIARKKALIGNEARVDDLYRQSVEKLKQWQAFYPAGITDVNDLQLSLQKKVESLATQYGIATSNVDWLPGAAEGLSRATVRFRLETAPEPFMRMLNALETGSRFIAIDGIRIQTRSRSKSEFTAEIDVSAYAIPEPLVIK